MNNIESLLDSYVSIKKESKIILDEIFKILDKEKIEEDLHILMEDGISDDIRYNSETKEIRFTNIHPEFSNYITYKIEELPLKEE
jgi:hypothetical protein